MAEPRAAGSALAAGLSRRSFLIGVCGAGLAFAFAPPCGAAAASPEEALAKGLFEPSIWYRIDGDGLVTVHVARAEMGQHVGTALARILAEELEADWARVRVEHVDTDPRWGEMVTGGSASVFEGFEPLSRAGAAGRIVLLEAGAELLGVPAAACRAEQGRIVSAAGALGYGEIVRRARPTRRFEAEELARLALKSASERRLLGRSVPALDVPAKTTGQVRYGIDASVPGMVYARPKIPPTRNGSRVVSVDDAAARGLPGYLRSIVLQDPSATIPGWVMVVAQTWDGARRAAEAVRVTWESDDTAAVSESDLLARAQALMADPGAGVRVVDDAGVEDAFAGAARVLEASYTTASALHFQLEPVNALAFEHEGAWEIHTGSQWQTRLQALLARALGVDASRIRVRSCSLGGGFGRRLNGDYAVPAALAAQVLGRPVKMICTREDDSRFDSFRSPTLQRLRLALGPGGAVRGMTHDAAAGWPNLVLAPDTLAKNAQGQPYDPDAISGAEHWYTVGAHRLRALSNDLTNRAFRPGWLRSVGSGWTNWALESFVDEAAHALRVDPLQFRLRLLDGQGRNAGGAPAAIGGARRQAQVLERAARRAGWGKALPKDTGLGLATSYGQSRDMPTWVACAARVHVDRARGTVQVQGLTLVVDAGTIIDRDGALAQVEGGALWGLSLALHEGTQFVRGQVQDLNLDSYTPLRMDQVPPLDIELVDRVDTPVGLGEPPTTVVAPAIGNAIFAAVGVRLRDLPMRAEALRRALG